MPVISGLHVCQSCGEPFTWGYHVRERMSTAGIADVIDYSQFDTMVKMYHDKDGSPIFSAHCPHCDSLVEFIGQD